MNIIEIYKKYHLPEHLQMHMLRVATCSSLIIDNWNGTMIDKESIIRASLLHGMENMAKISDDELIYIGRVIENMIYERISEHTIKYKDKLFSKAGEGYQFITKIEFGNEDEVEGKCIFKDYESKNNIISLGVLPDKENTRADVYADILTIEDIKIGIATLQ